MYYKFHKFSAIFPPAPQELILETISPVEGALQKNIYWRDSKRHHILRWKCIYQGTCFLETCQFFNSFCPETLILQRFSQDVPTSKDNVLQITKTRELLYTFSSISGKQSSCKALCPGSQSTGFWGLTPCNVTFSNWNTGPKFFSATGQPPTSSHCYFGEKNPPQQPTKKLTKNPTDKQTLTHMQRPCLKSCITIFMFFQTRKPKSSLSSFFSGSTDDESVLKLCVPFILDFTSSSCTTQSLTEPYN